MSTGSLPLRTRLVRWLARLLRVGRGPGETRSPAKISHDAQIDANARMRGWH